MNSFINRKLSVSNCILKSVELWNYVKGSIRLNIKKNINLVDICW